MRLPIGILSPQKMSFSILKASAMRNRLPILGAFVILSQMRVIGCFCFLKLEV
jgi:hypothetical protein